LEGIGLFSVVQAYVSCMLYEGSKKAGEVLEEEDLTRNFTQINHNVTKNQFKYIWKTKAPVFN